jgi:hypothetical protein
MLFLASYIIIRVMERGWSLNYDCWQELARLAIDLRNWHMVDLFSANEHAVARESGVYMICSKPPLNIPNSDSPNRNLIGSLLYAPLYIGRAKGIDGIRKRFQDHCKSNDSDMKDAKNTYIGPLEFWYLTVNEDYVDQLESCLIKCFLPPVNKNVPRGIRGVLGQTEKLS